MNLLWLLTTLTWIPSDSNCVVVADMYFEAAHVVLHVLDECISIITSGKWHYSTHIVVFEILTGVYHHRVQVLNNMAKNRFLFHSLIYTFSCVHILLPDHLILYQQAFQESIRCCEEYIDIFRVQ